MKTLFAFLILSWMFATLTYALPTINQFDSSVVVFANGSIEVQENINITTDGVSIRHGIYRDFPTQYKTTNGQDVNITFDVLSATLNNSPVPFHTQQLANGVRIYLGDRNRNLPADTYTFTLSYTAVGELGFFQDHDELYWNVTGNGWAYPITSATLSVQLPDDAINHLTGYTAYTGSQGSRDQNYRAQINGTKIIFQTTKPLESYQGLTIVLGWNKGFVTPPLYVEAAKPGINYLTLSILLGGLIILLFYYYIFWNKYGRDPAERVVIPIYEPPSEFTPAALRYILEMGYDQKVLAADIINLAVKGYLKIVERKSFFSKTYGLIKQRDFKGSLSKSETTLVSHLFIKNNVIELAYSPEIENAVSSYKEELKFEFENIYFERNNKFVYIGFFISIVIGVLAILTHVELMAIAFFILFISVFSYSLIVSKKTLRTILTGAIFFVGVFFVFFQVLKQLLVGDTVIFSILLLIIIVTNIVFTYLMKRPTLSGQQLLHTIKGFKLFLNATEKDRLNFRNPPNRTPEVFEKYLPYAIALGVEQAWAEQFTDVLAKADYHPSWYVGPSIGSFNATAFSSAMAGSFVNTISSASTPPGGSSGFSGGSSGGGGGGGGGGGW